MVLVYLDRRQVSMLNLPQGVALTSVNPTLKEPRWEGFHESKANLGDIVSASEHQRQANLGYTVSANTRPTWAT